MSGSQTRYDVAIIGSGISGSTLGAILARHGMRVIIFEAGVHPKFAVGESMILETSETMRAMAKLFDVPELAFFSSINYLAQIGASHGITSPRRPVCGWLAADSIALLSFPTRLMH